MSFLKQYKEIGLKSQKINEYKNKNKTMRLHRNIIHCSNISA